MAKEEMIKRLNDLESERLTIIAEQDAINYVMSLSMSTDSSRHDEIMSELSKRQRALDRQKLQWEYELRSIDAMVA